MPKFRALMLWTDAWLADTCHLTRTERGTYLDLLILMWRSPKFRVPNDDFWLSKHLRMSMSEVRNELRPLIKEFCRNDGNHITQKRLLRESREARLQSARAKSRWHNKKGDAETHATVTSNRNKKEEEARARPPSTFKTMNGGRANGKIGAVEACDRLIERLGGQSGQVDYEPDKDDRWGLSKR